MKAISLWQPWASLIACGAKPFETRDWAPPAALIGERIAIHAARKVDKDAAALATDLIHGQFQAGRTDLSDALLASWGNASGVSMALFGEVAMPVGCVVCTAVLDAAFLLGEPAEGTARPAAQVIRRMTSRPMPACFTVPYDDFGNYAPGRWAWKLSDVRPLKPPAPAKGAQRFFAPPQGWLTGGAA